MKRLFGMCVCLPMLALSACVTTDPNLYVGAGGINGGPALAPQGYGWQPGSKVEFILYSEPKSERGEVFSSPAPRSLGTITVDAYGMFGFTGDDAHKFPVTRSICGHPPAWAKPWVVAKDLTNNLVKFPEMYSPNLADLWFTYQPCG